MNEKEQLHRLYLSNKKTAKILFIISMSLFGAATAIIAGLVVMITLQVDVILLQQYIEGFTLQGILRDFFSLFISGAIATLLFSVLIFRRRANMFKQMYDNADKIKFAAWKTVINPTTVDVKPAEKPKGKYDDLIEEYRKLYEQGLITKEDFENKKKELLH